MNNMMTRALSGTVYVALIVGCTLGGYFYFFILIGLFASLGVIEFEKMSGIKRNAALLMTSIDAAVAGLIVILAGQIARYPSTTDIIAIGAIFVGLWIVLRLVTAVMTRNGTPARDFATGTSAVTYVALPLALMTASYAIAGAFTVMATFIMLWLNDTGAYLTGRSFGRRKLCERLSPKKTWEGFWGGFALCVVAGAVTGWMYDTTVAAIILFAVYGAAVSVMGTFGDLFESMVKRTVGVKDSGNLIPGHGGILDRIDSLLGVAPLTFIFCCIL